MPTITDTTAAEHTADARPVVFDNSYSQLPDVFYSRVHPTPVKAPRPIIINDTLAEQLGIDPQWLHSDDGLAMLAGNTIAPGSEPLAMAYAGHQFGQWVPQLGDGRAILLGEVIDHHGQRQDIQLKGAGRTAFSRGGDGRNWLGPVLREYLVSEAMAALGVPTTRALAAVQTGEAVLRENGPLPGAIVTRVASSHIRVGTFQYFYARQDMEALQQLTDYTIERAYPELRDADNPALALLNAVIERQAVLVAQWQSLGFIHGVMNTDNCSVSGLTIDYGPCAFMDVFSDDKVFSAIDRGGRYAWRNQPGIAHWNLGNLAQCLLPLIHTDKEQAVAEAQGALDQFDPLFVGQYTQRMAAKIGLSDTQSDDLLLVQDLLDTMQSNALDFTETFSLLSDYEPDNPDGMSDDLSHAQHTTQARNSLTPTATSLFSTHGALGDWYERWQQRLGQDSKQQQQARVQMQAVNPVVIPRNHLIEALIEKAISHNDFSDFHALLSVVTTPFDRAHKGSHFTQPPTAEETVERTFCGT